ncbi:hypothetical protein KSD_96990 [Ktedonobacter sp. SOSP1-85]|nr:hypothetical protein KSD_96990 [Ktedonobacter sp. SOSP1-85]
MISVLKYASALRKPQGLKPQAPDHGFKPMACGRLKPKNVRSLPACRYASDKSISANLLGAAKKGE